MVDIETAATSVIKNRIADTDRLSQYINERDKEPIWDGAIYAYDGKSRSNESMIGKAPVQVKGKTLKTCKKDRIKYPVSVSNLKQYRDDGGVLYFVVVITPNKEKTIFYASLLPYAINNYVNVAHGKTLSITLKKLPETDYDFENIVINFVNERKRQLIGKNGKNWTIEEVAELVGKDNIHMNFNFTCIGYDKRDPFSYLKDNEIYLYAGNKDGSLAFPVEHIQNIEMVVHETNVAISAKGKHYYDKVKVERHRDDSVVIYMGKSFRYVVNKPDQVTFKYDLKGNLDEQIQTIEFLLDVIDDKGLYINGTKCAIEPTTEELSQFNRTGAENKLKYLRLIKDALNILGVKESLNLDMVTDKQEEYIKMLINCLLYGKRAGFTEKGEIPPLGTITIGNLRIMLLFREKQDGRYEVNDFFRYKVDCKLDQEGDYDTTQFCMLTADDYLNTANIDLEVVEHEFMEHRNEGHYERMTFSILEMIKAYDRDNKRSNILDMAIRLNKWLVAQDGSNPIYVINLFQCYKRIRNLTDEELKTLSKLLESDRNDEGSKAAIYILLDSKKIAEMHIANLKDDEKASFMEFPIYSLFKNLE